MGTNESGLARFDLASGWEDYHNKNSGLPSCYIYSLSQDSRGDLYISTYYGMVRVRKK